MPLLLEIGSQKFVIKKDADAAKAMSILCDAVQVDWDYEGKYSDRRYRYYPAEQPDEISLKNISMEQCVRCKQADLPKAQLQLKDCKP